MKLFIETGARTWKYNKGCNEKTVCAILASLKVNIWCGNLILQHSLNAIRQTFG